MRGWGSWVGAVATLAITASINGIFIAPSAAAAVQPAMQPVIQSAMHPAIAPLIEPDFLGQPATPAARQAAQWLLTAGNAAGKPFAVVDKKDARIYVFKADGRLAGTAPVLLGLALGDGSAPGVAQKIKTGIPRHERTTPAGRFDSQPGRNDKGEAIVWVDYHAAVAIHRLRPAPASERRPERLASPDPMQRRISLGCVVVAPAFYDQIVAPTLGRERGVVLVLPDAPAQLATAS